MLPSTFKPASTSAAIILAIVSRFSSVNLSNCLPCAFIALACSIFTMSDMFTEFGLTGFTSSLYRILKLELPNSFLPIGTFTEYNGSVAELRDSNSCLILNNSLSNFILVLGIILSVISCLSKKYALCCKELIAVLFPSCGFTEYAGCASL